MPIGLEITIIKQRNRTICQGFGIIERTLQGCELTIYARSRYLRYIVNRNLIAIAVVIFRINVCRSDIDDIACIGFLRRQLATGLVISAGKQQRTYIIMAVNGAGSGIIRLRTFAGLELTAIDVNLGFGRTVCTYQVYPTIEHNRIFTRFIRTDTEEFTTIDRNFCIHCVAGMRCDGVAIPALGTDLSERINHVGILAFRDNLEGTAVDLRLGEVVRCILIAITLVGPIAGTYTIGVGGMAIDIEYRIAGNGSLSAENAYCIRTLVLMDGKGAAAHIHRTPTAQQIHIATVVQPFAVITGIHVKSTTGDIYLCPLFGTHGMRQRIIEETPSGTLRRKYLVSRSRRAGDIERTAAHINNTMRLIDRTSYFFSCCVGLESHHITGCRRYIECTAGNIQHAILARGSGCINPTGSGYSYSTGCG